MWVHACSVSNCNWATLWTVVLTLCDSIDSISSGCSVLGILQARVLQWVAISYSKEAMEG